MRSLSGDLVIGQVTGGGEFEWVISQMFVEAVFECISEGALTTASGRVYHTSTILLLKLFLLRFKGALRLNSLRLCPLALPWLENVNKASVSGLSIPLMIL